jgi:hypothetical protein
MNNVMMEKARESFSVMAGSLNGDTSFVIGDVSPLDE